MTRKTIIRSIAGYLIVGAIFALNTLPQTMWACPAPGEPHGQITYNRIAPEDRDRCWRTRTLGEDAAVVAFGSVAWLPLILARALSGSGEP